MNWSILPSEIEELADALQSQDETQDTAADLARDQAKYRATWSRSLSVTTRGTPIRIPPPRNQGLHPRLCQVGEAWIDFEFELAARDAALPKVADMQVRVKGLVDIHSGPVEVEDHWRVDTDRYVQSAPREPHPSFHFQRGGHAQDAFAAHPLFVPGDQLPAPVGGFWRGLMQSPSPRLPIPPMCPVLMIDFALSQHDGNIWQRLRARADYARVIARAQTRLWNPFFDSLAHGAARRKWFGSIVG